MVARTVKNKDRAAILFVVHCWHQVFTFTGYDCKGGNDPDGRAGMLMAGTDCGEQGQPRCYCLSADSYGAILQLKDCDLNPR